MWLVVIIMKILALFHLHLSIYSHTTITKTLRLALYQKKVRHQYKLKLQSLHSEEVAW